MYNFEIHYTLNFPGIEKISHYDDKAETIGTTTAVKIGKALWKKFSSNQKKILPTLVVSNEDIKSVSEISIRKNKETFLDTQNTDPLSWEIANYLFEEIKKPIKSP